MHDVFTCDSIVIIQMTFRVTNKIEYHRWGFEGRREGWLLEFFILETSKVISEWLLTYDCVHSWQLYSAASLGNQITDTMT